MTMQVRGVRGAILPVAFGLAVLPSVIPEGVDVPGGVPDEVVPAAEPASGGRLMLVRHAGTMLVVIDTTKLAGPALRGWWVDDLTGKTVDAGSVPRGPAVVLHPPDTGDAAARDWTLVVVDATRGLAPPA
jgi:hypothetical protein